jgi:hypothetical protein
MWYRIREPDFAIMTPRRFAMKHSAALAARDPLLNPPPFRGRKATAAFSYRDETLLACGLLFLPLEGGG